METMKYCSLGLTANALFEVGGQYLDDWMYEQVAETYALAAGMQQFFADSNPWALNAIAERLLEAANRGLWAAPSPEIRAALQQVYLQSETLLEARNE